MNRETQTIITPSQKELVIKTYLTARERNELRAVYLNDVVIDPQSGGLAKMEIKGSLIEVAETKLINLAVVSYDNSEIDILNRLLEGRPEEYDFVLSEVNKLNNSFTGAK